MNSQIVTFCSAPIRLAVLVVACLLLSGCTQKAQIPTEYGKVSGSNGPTSLNGTSVFYDMFRERGFRTKRRKKISPRIDRYDSVVWFPDDRNCPSDEVVDRLNEWMNEGYDRTLIYVGRDYESQTDYLGHVKNQAPLEDKEEMLRQMAEARLSQDTADFRSDFWYQKNRSDECDWFEKKKLVRAKSISASGELGHDLDPEKISVEVATILAPRDYESDAYQATTKAYRRHRILYEAAPLLTIDGEDFVYQLVPDEEDESGNKVIVVSNGSFLLNFPLVYPENRKLAGRLIDQVDPYSDVLFLESGPEGIAISDSDITNHNNWAWIAEPPLRYIVPQFLLWGIIFCFVYFPIFGRPKRIKRRNLATFRSHIDATGMLIGRSKLPNKAANRIKKYQDSVSGESNRKRKD